MTAVARVELAKLWALRRTRALVVLALVGPWLACAALQLQSGLPTDALFGRWVQETGFAFPLVVLAAVAPWAVPLLASVVAAESFATEHHLGTWSTLLGRGRTVPQLLWGKAVVSLLSAVALVVLLALGALASGLVLVGAQDLVGLSGQSVEGVRAVALVLGAWAGALPVAVAVAALALLLSALSRNAVVALVVPPLATGGLVLLGQLAPLGGLRPVLPTSGLTAWHALLKHPADAGPLLVSAAVAGAYAIVLLGLLRLLAARRDGVLL